MIPIPIKDLQPRELQLYIKYSVLRCNCIFNIYLQNITYELNFELCVSALFLCT